MAKPTLSQEYVQSLFEYDAATGMLRWKLRQQSDFATKRAWSIINTRNGGKTVATQSRGYYVVGIKNRRYRVHRIIWLMFKGEMPAGEIDHINGNPSDNRIENLRLVSPLENRRNMKTPKNNTSGEIGVSFRRQRNTWRAYIMVNNQQLTLGHFPTKLEATAARSAGERLLGFHRNHGR